MLKKERIDNTTAFFMTAVALILFDAPGGLINLIPVAGQILSDLISLLGFMTMCVWFVLRGVKFFSGENANKTVATGAVSLIIEAVPGLNALPALTFFVVRTILMVKSEDRVNALKESASGKISRALNRGLARPRDKTKTLDTIETPETQNESEGTEEGSEEGNMENPENEGNGAAEEAKSGGGLSQNSLPGQSNFAPDQESALSAIGSAGGSLSKNYGSTPSR